MPRIAIAALLVFALAGCGAPQLNPDGTREEQPRPAPAGFKDYCDRHPERQECGGSVNIWKSCREIYGTLLSVPGAVPDFVARCTYAIRDDQ